MYMDGERARGRLELRYEDVAQDGRVRLETIASSLGVVWRSVAQAKPARDALKGTGILPILTRLELEATEGPFGIEVPVDVAGGYAVAHARDDAGEVTRLFLDMDATLTAPKGRTQLPPPPDAGTIATVGTVRAEHVFTRPFAPEGQRKVLALPLGGDAKSPVVPGPTRPWRPPHATLDMPPGARAMEPELALDPVLVAVGLAHTDSNQHVNSLVYPRLFEEAALRRLVELGRPATLLARAVDLAYRRPSFAGDRLRIALRGFEEDGRVVFVGAFFGEGERDVARARVFVRTTFA